MIRRSSIRFTCSFIPMNRECLAVIRKSPLVHHKLNEPLLSCCLLMQNEGKKGQGENCIEFLEYFYILSPRAHYHARLSKSGECSLVNSRRRVTLITKSPFLFPFPQVGEKEMMIITYLFSLFLGGKIESLEQYKNWHISYAFPRIYYFKECIFASVAIRVQLLHHLHNCR